MPIGCKTHTAALYDRGGVTRLGGLGQLSRVQWERLRDDISQASVTIESRSAECDKTLGLAAAGRSELVIFRGGERVWEGPITHITHQGSGVKFKARDIGHYIYRTIMKQEYDNTYPNASTVTKRVGRILRSEMARMEAQDPPVNVLPYLVVHEDPENAGTSSRTLPYELTVFEHMDALAARGGLDYAVLGRALHLWDTHYSLGQTETVTANDFIGDVVITEYGMELATVSAVTDGRGRAGVSGEADPFYGLVEVLDTAYDESTGDAWDDEDNDDPPEPPSINEMKSQAKRILSGRNPTPVVVRVPDNSTLNPRGVLSISDLMPGVHIPLQARLPGRELSQLQKLDNMSVEENENGEEIKVTLSPAPIPGGTAGPSEEGS